MDSTDLDQEAIDQISEAFAAAIRRGEQPSVDQWVSKHADRQDELRELLTSVAMIEGLKSTNINEPGTSFPPPEHAAPDQLGDYRIVREIGRGGMGIVYEAVNESLERRVAVKVLSSRLLGESQHLDRFRREARAAASLRHPNIVPVFGVGQFGDIHYYVMDFVDGQSVSDWLRSLPTIDAANTSAGTTDRSRWVADIGAKLCDALQYAHDHDVLHRDIKPDNLLLDAQGEIWITDFGLAKLTQQQSMTHTGDLLGTPQYMAPESFEGQFDHRSEVYSIGLTLYEMLTQQPAITGSNPAGTLRNAIAGVTSRPSQWNVSIPRDLETVILKSLSVDPASRYPSAGAMRDDLNRFLADKPVLARRIGLAERALRWTRREPVLAGLIAATIASLMTALVVAGVGYYQTRRSLNIATDANLAAERSLLQRTAALDLAEKQRVRAENNLQVAISAFDQIMHNIAERGESLDAQFLGELSETTSPNISSADAELLQSLLGFFDELAANNSEDLRIQSADASRRVGDIYQRLGQLRKADQAYQRAAKLYQSLRENTDINDRFAIMQAKVLNEQAVIAGMLGQPYRVSKAYDQTIACLKESIEKNRSAEAKFQQARAQMLLLSTRSRAGFDSGHLRSPTRRPGIENSSSYSNQTAGQRGAVTLREAASMMIANEAIDTLQGLVNEFPENTEYQMELARAYRDASKVAAQHRFGGPAKSWSRQSLRMFDDLLDESPKSDSIRYELAKTLAVSDSFGIDRMMHLNRAVRLCDSLLERNPNVTSYHALKAHTLGTVAELHRRTGAEDRAMVTLLDQVEIQRELIEQSPELLSYRTKLAQTDEKIADIHNSNGDAEQAAKYLQDAIEALIPAVRRSEPSNIARVQLQRLRGKLNQTENRVD
tara:strand:+ start:63963 stop:66629 length:2667 start_codon:yes stop_codon:yes gene_type:complete